MLLTDEELSERMKNTGKKDSFRSWSTMSANSSSISSREETAGSPTAMVQALIRDLSFWDAIPPAQTLPQALPQRPSQQRIIEQEERDVSFREPYRSSTRGYDRIRSYNREKRTAMKNERNHHSSSWEKPQMIWKSAIDPMTGRTYWYDAVTRRTQWEKPQELREIEKRKRAQRKKKDVEFFKEMERNVLQSLSRGELIPSIPTAKLEPTGPPLEPANVNAIVGKNVRTLSKMDDTILAELRDDVVSPEEFNRAIQAQARTKPKSSLRGRPPLPNSNRSFVSAEDNRISPAAGRRVVDTLDTIEAQVEKKRVSIAPDLRSGRSKTSSPATATSAAGEDPVGPDSLAGEHLLDGPINTEALSFGNDNKSPGSSSKSHVRRNTGGTIYVKSTMSNPDVEATIKCVCGVYRAHMVQAAEQRSFSSPVSVMGKPLDTEIFDDRYHLPRQWKHNMQQGTLPHLFDIVEFYQEFYRRSQMEHDTIIMSLIYVERLIKTANVSPTPENWRSILFSSMVLASKVWDDLSMWNIDFSNVASAHSQGLSLFTLQRVNQLELVLLKSLNFDVRVPASEYAKYYFLIRTMLMRSGLLEDVAKPLGKEDARSFESRTSHYQDSKLGGDQQRDRRSKSMYDYSWFEKTQDDDDGTDLNLSLTSGPVLKDKICLEQLVDMSER